MTGNDVISDAFLLHGIIYAGQALSSAQSAAGQLALNNMLAEWNAQGLAVFSIVKSTFTLVANTNDYLIGPGGSGSFNTARPEKIEAWRVIDSSGAANGGKPVGPAEFAAMAEDSSLTSSLIRALNYDAAFPNGTIHLYPTPNAAATGLELWVWEQMAAITDFTQTLSFPPGYLKAIIYNLAIDLATKFGRPLDATVQMIATQTKATLGGTNTSEMTRKPALDPAPLPPRQ